jgi:hypothetical protein
MNATRTALTAAVLCLAAAALSLGACSRDAGPRRHDGLPPDEATALLDKRVWLDKEPRGPNDTFDILVFDRRSSSGIFQHRTIWKGEFELFRYEAQKGRIDMKLPGSHRRVQTGFTVERQKRGDADVKLTLERSPRGPTVYYGYRFDGHDVDAWVATTFGERP